MPLLCAMDAEVTLVSAGGERRIAVRDLYNDDGIKYLTKEPGELLTEMRPLLCTRMEVRDQP